MRRLFPLAVAGVALVSVPLEARQPERAPGTLELRRVEVDDLGGIEPMALEAAVRDAFLPGGERCAAKQRLNVHEEATNVRIHFEIRAGGATAGVRVSGLRDDDPFAPCLKGVLDGAKFPAPAKNAVARLKVTLLYGAPAAVKRWKRPVKLGLTVVVTSGSADVETVKGYVWSRRHVVERCYHATVRHDEWLEGDLELDLVLGVNGRVDSVTARGLAGKLRSCVTANAQNWVIDGVAGERSEVTVVLRLAGM